MPWPGIAGKPVKVEVLYMNHGPLQASLQEIRNVFSQYKGKISVSCTILKAKRAKSSWPRRR